MAHIDSDFTCVYCTATGTIFGTTDVYELGFSHLSISIFINYTFSWVDGSEALRDTLEMEKQVSLAFKALINSCDSVQDYYSADYLTGTWLQEQLAGQRELAGMINTLSNFRKDHEALADWMFSNNLLKKLA